jgi:serine/threonine protein kinase
LPLHFQVTRKSHATAVSQIYEAVNGDRCQYFIEVLGTASSDSWLDGFKRDLAAVAQLQHPGVLQVLEIGAMPDGTPVIVTDRPQGITLARWLARGHVAPTDAALDLLTGLAHALGCLHDIGVSHGALSADDVLLVDLAEHALGLPRLRGFGYRWLRAAPPTGDRPAVVPGERTIPASRREIASDIAALAELADRLLTPLRNSEQITSVIRAATLLGEDGRFASPAAFVEALEAALDPRLVLPEEMTEPTLKVPWLLRRRGLRRVMATAVATIALAAGVRALVSARNAPPAISPVVVRPRPAPTPPLALQVQPAPPPAPPKSPTVARTIKAPARGATKLWRVWSEREQRLIYVDEQGAAVQPPPDATAN